MEVISLPALPLQNLAYSKYRDHHLDHSYRLVFSGGDSLGAPSSVAFPYSVSPGYWMDISVPLRAPNAAGTFQGNWMLQSSDGTLFGVGCNGQVPIWVKISTVSNSCATVAYSCNNCNVNYCNPACYGSYYNQITKNPYCNNKIRSVNDITIPDDTEMDPGTSFRKTWSMKNGGTCVWNEGYSLIFSGGDAMGWKTPVFLPNPVYPGETVEISIDLKAPTFRETIVDTINYAIIWGLLSDTDPMPIKHSGWT